METTKKENDKYVDIDVLIDKVSKLPISDAEKVDLLKKFKENMMHPSRGEIESLNRIQSRYSPNMQPPTDLLPSNNPYFNQMAMQSPSLMMMQPQQQGLTVAHFDILRNKMDSIQLELVDLLRHVKDYTQRYMNATRQQDMEKIDAYINGLFEIDKKMRRVEEQTAAIELEEEKAAAATEPEKSTITRATDGIKNFLGSIGDGVSGITNFVSSTANIVNDTLSKKVIGGTTPSTTPNPPNPPNTTASTSKPSSNKSNILSIDDYIKSNMNQIESSPTPNLLNNTNSNTNSNTNITSSNNLNAMASEVKTNLKPLEKTTENKVENKVEDEQEELTKVINKLNDTMNADIDNTVSQQLQTQSGGSARTSRKENHITRKIHLLKLRLTQHKLEKQLQKHNTNNNKKTKHKIPTRSTTHSRTKFNKK